MFYAFRDPDERAAFIASRYRREIVVPRLTRSVDRFEDHKAVLQPLMDFLTARGRLPDVDELPETAAVISALGSLKRAFHLIQSATGAEAWAEIAAKRAQDLLIYLALARFDRRPMLGQLPLALQRDVKTLFPSYGQACKQADALLFSVGRTDEVNGACAAAPRHYETFELPEVPDRLLPDKLAITFLTNRDGNIVSLSAPLEPMVKDIVFVRLTAGDCTLAAFRERCVGSFKSSATTHRVTLDTEGRLVLKSDNQPAYRLAPQEGRRFRIVELEGFFVEFRGEGTIIDELIFHQPNGTFVAKSVDQLC